jgi:regulatory protein
VEHDAAAAERTAVGLLAAREHASAELRRKLRQRGFESAVVEDVIGRLAARGLQSDERFVEGYVAERGAKGFGPVRIRAELEQRGVEDALIRRHLSQDEGVWMALASRAHDRKFGAGAPADAREFARRARFLEYRGFTASQIGRLLGPLT